LLGIFLAVIALIVYGSLYPWHFAAKVLPGNPLWLLFHSWGAATGRRFVADEIVNIALYIPLGMSGYLALRNVWLPVLVGAVFSGCIEMTQLFTPNRNCSTEDLLTNIAGSAVGVVVGLVFQKVAGPVQLRYRGPATLLLWCGIAALVFPLFPATSLPLLREKIMAFVNGPVLSPVSLISALAWWLAMGSMWPSRWLWPALLLIPGQIAIVTRQPAPVDLIGAVCGLSLSRMKLPGGLVAAGFLAVLLLRGLAPFHFSSLPHNFEWIPFGGFLNTDWQYGIQVFLEKLFWYGAALCLLRRAGLQMAFAICLVCPLLALIEAIQIYVPGRTAEITDPLLALFVGLAIMQIHD
jgi:VanZ family protein